jgi:hypothetical protein
MNSLRKAVGLLTCMMLAAFALPAAAADKLFLVSAKVYTLSGTTVSSIGSNIPQGTSTYVLLLNYANQSPQGANSVIKSIDAYIPTDVKWAYANSKTVNVTSSSGPVDCTAPPSSYFSTVPTTFGLGGEASTTTYSYTQNNLTGVKPQGHFCLYLAVKTNSTSCSASNWKVEANTGNSITGGVPFVDYNVFQSTGQSQPYTMTSTTDGCTGILGCDTTNNTAGNLTADQDIAYIGTPDWGLVRSQTNKDLLNCTAAVPFNFVFEPTANPQKATFTIPPNNLNQAVAVEYVLLWTPVPVDGVSAGDTAGWSTTPSGRPKMAWVKDVNNSYVYVNALRCVVDDITIGYAALPKIPNTPYWVAIGAQFPDYAPGAQAKMCVAQEGSTSVTQPPYSPGQQILIQYWHKVLDYADGTWTFND